MENEALSKLIPISVLLFLGIIEALGGLYFNDRRTKNDFSIELLSLRYFTNIYSTRYLSFCSLVYGS